MIEHGDGYIVSGLDGILYLVEHVWTTWTVRLIDLDALDEKPLVLVIQEPWAKVEAEGRLVDGFGRPLGGAR